MKGRIIRSSEVKPFIIDETYSSKMLLDNDVAGRETININEGTLAGGRRTGGGVHEKDEIYYIVRGEAIMVMDNEETGVEAGCVVFIPAGAFHYLINKSTDDEVVILTFWPKAEDNEVYNVRKKAWGKSFKTIDED